LNELRRAKKNLTQKDISVFDAIIADL